ncbi:MAG: response regulator transcription factor [Lachnospiraceae bacterium]|nr:response regulator transcription factor [Lachnospiraceae bacterium]
MDSKMKIMLVEDDTVLSQEVEHFLQKWGYKTIMPTQFDAITETFEKEQPHLVLMDVNLPYYDGFYWCRKIREISEVPILYISSRDDDGAKLMAMAQGGDDYMEKPFHLEILQAKIEAILRRTYQYKVRERVYLRKEMYYDPTAAFFLVNGKAIDFTKSEQRIMIKLMESRPEIVTRDALMNLLWNTDEFVSDGTLTTMISRLRNKLTEVCGEEIIKTKKGQGYYIE